MRLLLALLLLAPSAFAAQVRGVVYSSDGQPLANAQIRAYRPEARSAAIARAARDGEREPLASTVSSDDGTFAVDAKTDGVIELVVTRDGSMPHARLEIAGEESIVELSPAEPRTGRVTSGGKPVANARVLAWSQTTAILSARTDANGAFAMPNPRSCCVAVVVLHPEFATQVLPVGRLTANRLQIELDRGIAVKGKVVDAAGKPVAKATVMQHDWPAATSGEDGTFTIAHADPKAKIVAAAGSLRGTAAAASDVVIPVSRSRSVTGSIRDAAKKPLPGAIVWVYGEAGGDSEFEVANDKGEFAVHGLSAADISVWPIAGDTLSFEPQQANLTRKETARLEFVAERREMLQGIVRDEEKRPVGGASVRLTSTQEPLIYHGGEAGASLTGPDGRFRLAANEYDEAEVRIIASHPRFGAALSDVIKRINESSRTPIAITLPRGIEVRGLVVDAKDHPIAGAGVILLQDSPGAMPLPLDVAMLRGSISPFVRSGPDGRFTVHLNAAPHDIAIAKEGFAPARIGGFEPRAGSPLRVVLEPAVEIRGRIAPANLQDVFVSARGADRTWATGIVDPSGAFTIANLTPGNYEITVTVGAVHATKNVRAPATDVVIELPKSGELRGRVTDKATGGPIDAPFNVNIEAEGDERGGILRGNADGTFGGPVPPGTKKVTISARGYVSQTVPVTIEAEKPAEVTIALSRGRRIHGRVTSSDGRPLSNAQVSLDANGFMGDTGTDESGEYELIAVPTDAVTIVARRDGFQSRQIAIEAGETDRAIDIVMSSGRKAVGRVIDENGAAVEGVEVSAIGTALDSDYQSAQTDAAGNFTIEGLGPGRHQFRASKARVGATTVNDVDIAAGPILITLRSAAATGTIRGVVKGYADGAWMMGMVTASPARVTDTGFDKYANARIGRDGTFRIDDAPSGEVRVQAQLMSTQRQISTPPVIIAVPPGGEAQATLVVRTDVVVRGRITESGQAAAGHQVTFQASEGYWRTTSGDDGVYEVVGLEPALYTVTVSSGRTQFSTKRAISGSETFDIDITFRAIHGRVLDDEGAAVAGATIRLADQAVSEVVTDAAGAFSLRVSDSEAHTVTASKRGYAHAAVTAQPNGPPVVLKLARSDGLYVRLVDARDGTTLDGYVVATDARGTHVPSSSEGKRDGAVHVPVAHGAYRIAASADGYASQSVRTNVPLSGELRIALTPGGTLIVQADRESYDLVKLVMPNGEEYVRCHCNGIAEIRLTGRTTTIEHVAPGTYAMQLLDARGKVKATVPVTVTEGGATRAEVNVPRD